MLSQEGFRVTVFEKGSRPGLSAHSRDFSQFIPEATNELPGDVPSRMFNDSLWPSVTKIYREAGIAFEPVDHQQTFFQNDDVLIKIGLPYSTAVLNNVFNPVARRMLGLLAEFQKVGLVELDNGAAEYQTFGDFVDSQFHQDSFREFFDCFLFPALTSTVFTCPKSDLRNYPSHLVLDALHRITVDGNPLMRTVHGSDHAANSLLSNIKDVRFNTAVIQVSSGPESATIHTERESFEFDHVIVATQANHASQIIVDDLPKESALLRRFQYVDVPITVHTDSGQLPSKKADWGTFNFDSFNPEATCTVWMNRFHQSWPKTTDVFHSIFPSDSIGPDHILFSAVMQRPVVDANSQQLYDALNEFHSDNRRVWFVGSYASPGVPLLESAVASSRNAVSKLTAQQVREVNA